MDDGITDMHRDEERKAKTEGKQINNKIKLVF